MPSSVVRALAQKAGRPVSEVEAKWEEAKNIVKKKTKESDDKFYPTVVHVLKNMLNLNEDATVTTGIATVPKRLGDKPVARVGLEPDGNMHGFPYFEIKDSNEYLKIAGDKRMNKKLAINDERVFKHLSSNGSPFLIKHKDNYIKLTKNDFKGR